MQRRFPNYSQDWQSEKLAAFRVSSEYRVFCIGEYISTHKIRNNQKFGIWDQNPHAMKTHRTFNLLYFNCAPQLPHQQKESSSITRYVRKNHHEFNMFYTLQNIEEGIPSAATLWGLCRRATLWMWVKSPSCHSQPATAKLKLAPGQGPGRAAVCPSSKSGKPMGKYLLSKYCPANQQRNVCFQELSFAIHHV